MTDGLVADPGVAVRWHVDGAPPWFPNLATVLEPAPDLLDELFTEFSPIGAALRTQDSFWLGFHTWVVERFIAQELRGVAAADQRAAIWAVYATSYWSMLELTLHFGVPPAVINLGMEAVAPSEDSVSDLVTKLTGRQEALAGDGTDLVALLATLMREEPCTGTLHGTAYNAGYCEVISEHVPLGELPVHLDVTTGAIRANARDFMRLDYAIPVPEWLSEWRTRFEIAVRANPDAFDAALAGDGAQKDLRAIWGEALDWGHNNWGGQSLDKWTQEYFEDVLHWSLVFNTALEGVSLAGFVALVDRDADAALRAVRANTVFLGSWGAAVMGLLDVDGHLPTAVPA
jgi:hypothetical protein